MFISLQLIAPCVSESAGIKNRP